MYSQNRVTWYQLSCTLCHQYCHTYMNFWTQNSKTFFFFYLKAICRIPPSNVFNAILTVGRHAIALWVMSVCWVGPSGLESRTVLGLSVGCHDCLGQQPDGKSTELAVTPLQYTQQYALAACRHCHYCAAFQTARHCFVFLLHIFRLSAGGILQLGGAVTKQ